VEAQDLPVSFSLRSFVPTYASRLAILAAAILANSAQLSLAAAAAVFYHRVIATVASFLPPPPFLVSPSSRRQNLDTAQLSRAAAANLHAALQLKRRCPAGPSHMSLMLKTTSDEQATCRFTR
jgi:hypothetical protein